MKNVYGKPVSTLTKGEQKLLNKDILMFTSLMMKKNGESLIGLSSRINMGTQEDFDQRGVDRDMYSGVKLLGLKKSRVQKTFEVMCEIVQKSQYSFYKFCDDYTRKDNQ